MSYIIYIAIFSLPISPFLFKCPDLQLKEEMKTLSAKAFSFLSWALESLYIYSIFSLTILFMAKWIRNNKYQPVDLLSLVRSHISYWLQENSILSNLSCQAYIEENHQSQIPNSSSWGQVLNSSNLLLPMNVPYCSVK